MMGHQTRNESLFYYFRLEEQIPDDHLLRLIDRYIDLSFVRERLKGFYSVHLELLCQSQGHVHARGLRDLKDLP
jgi:hypothetical protein